jgi:hypothetical protein
MKKILIGTSTLVLSLLLTGCGGPKLPEDTLAAAYVDLELALDNGVNFIEAAIAEFPDSAKDKAKKLLNENLDKFEDDLDDINPEWALVMVCGSKDKEPKMGVVVKCDYEAKVSQAENAPLKELLTQGAPEYKTINDSKVYRSGGMLVTFVDGKYILMVESCAEERADYFMRKLVSLYRDGDGETSGDFGDLCDLDDDVVARIKTAEAGTIIDLMGVRKLIEEFGENCDDEELAENILDIGSLVADVMIGDSEFGVRLEFDAGSSEIAKVLEGLLNTYVFASRVTVDVFSGMSNMLGVLGVKNKDATKAFSGDAGRELAKIVREAPEVDRSGSTVTFESVIDTEDFMELIIPQFKEEISSALDMM